MADNTPAPAPAPPAPKENESAMSLISKANEAAERLEKANKQMEQLTAKMEAMRVEQTLSGHSEAGIKAPQKTQEEKEIESARKMLEGTGFEDLFDEPKKH